MQLVKFDTAEPPAHIKKAMTSFFMLEKYRQFSIKRPTAYNQQMKHQPGNQEDPSFQVNRQGNQQINQSVQSEIIKCVKGRLINSNKQRKMRALHNLYLTHFLNMTNLQACANNQPPLLSVLELKEEGDYLCEGRKKDYPHFSNTIKPTEIPNEIMSSKFIPKVHKKCMKQYWTAEQNCVFKIRQINHYISYLFKYGNESFERVAEKTKMSVRSAKMLYDMLNDFLDVQDRIDRVEKSRSPEYRKKQVDYIRKFLRSALRKYKPKQINVSSVYVPVEEEHMSLAELKQYLRQKFDHEDKSD